MSSPRWTSSSGASTHAVAGMLRSRWGLAGSSSVWTGVSSAGRWSLRRAIRRAARLGRRDADLVARVADRGDGLDVVPVAVGLEHLADVEPLAQLEQPLVLVGRVEQHRVTRLLAAQDVDVVVHRTDADLGDLGLGV